MEDFAILQLSGENMAVHMNLININNYVRAGTVCTEAVQ